jgi:AraC family transcriptional regulator
MPKHGVYGERLREVFHLEDAPAFVTQALEKTEIAVTWIKCDIANNGLTNPIPRENAYLVTLQLRDCPEHRLWIDEKPAPTGPLARGVTCIYDLRGNPIADSVSPFESLHFYLPREVLDFIADMDDLPRVGDIKHDSGLGVDDPVVRGLGMSLLPSFDRPEEASRIFVDHVTIALACHFAQAYGSVNRAARSRRDGLDRRHERRTTDMLDANLDGDLSMSELARACGLPISEFSRAFRRSTHMLPHEWLERRRVHKAMGLLHDSRRSLVGVAHASGFASLVHFIRVFTRVTGASPIFWRRRDN